MLFNLDFNIWFSNIYFKTQKICFNQIEETLQKEVQDEYKDTHPFTQMIKLSYLRMKASLDKLQMHSSNHLMSYMFKILILNVFLYKALLQETGMEHTRSLPWWSSLPLSLSSRFNQLCKLEAIESVAQMPQFGYLCHLNPNVLKFLSQHSGIKLETFRVRRELGAPSPERIHAIQRLSLDQFSGEHISIRKANPLCLATPEHVTL